MDEKLKPYEEYKETNILWNEKTPLHWDIKRGKEIFKNKKEINSKYQCSNILSLTLKGVVNNNEYKPIGLVPKDYATYQIFEKHNLVFKLIDLENYKTSRVGLVHERGIMSPAYIRLESYTECNIKYFYYQYYDLYLRGIYNKLGEGVRSTLSGKDLLNLRIAVPPKKEQDQIVKYIDSKLTKINKFIKAKKKQVELLKEQRKAIVNQVVTKGLDPNVKMKLSGIEWIGDIPKEWSVCRCKYLFFESNTRSQTGEEAHLSMSQKHGLIPNNLLTERRLLSENYAGGKLCEKNDLVLNRLKAHLGVFALAPQAGVISPDYTVLRPNRLINPKYSELVLKSEACRGELRVRVRGIVEGFWRLYTEDFNKITIPLPNIEEQKEIVDYIETKIQKIDKIIEKIKQEINFITEYRNTLISDVVTGKIDVRNISVEDTLEVDLKVDEDVEDENQGLDLEVAED